MPANVPSLFLLPLDLLTQEKKIAKMKLGRAGLPSSSCSPAALDGERALLCLDLGGKVPFGWKCVLCVETCPLGESQPCANPVAVNVNEATASRSSR